MVFLDKNLIFHLGIVVLHIFIGFTDAKQLISIKSSNEISKPFAIERIQLTDELRERAAAESLKTINEAAKKSVEVGGDEYSASICEEGFKIAFKLLGSCRKNLNDAFITAHKLARNEPEAAVAVLNKAAKLILDYIFVATVPVQTVHGSALARVGELARPQLRTAMELLQHCGVILLESLHNAERLASIGIKAGGDASDIAIVAAHEIFNSGEETIYKLLIDSALSAFEGLKFAAGKAPIRGFTKNLDNFITSETPEAQITIDQLTIGFEEALNRTIEEPAIEALQTIYHSFLSSILDNSNAIAKAYRAIDGAEQLLDEDPKIAVAALHKGLVAVDNAILAVSADAILGLGAAGEICGEKVRKLLEPAVISVVEGRVNLFMDLTLAEKVAVIGLRAGNIAAKQSLVAARASVSAASNALFTHFIDAAHKAFAAIQNYY